ncbi:type II secretion system F family protein [Pengzhenrongella frigida]|uniref:Secretion system protein n=1 Tax=Pengzhenrongella frigida TaxID=1259133 RepID=A0A4Q5MUY5_9MICO|nr:type II secretion system F family protein [Cellulomonas sp. HLT2-17]RYV49382.1 secretion system protein [Cellulomonas sp. HLT2-17]
MRLAAVAIALTLCLLGAGAPWLAVRSAARLPVVGVRARPDHAEVARATGSIGPPGRLDVLVLLDLLDAAIASGVSLPRALAAVGDAAGGVDGGVLKLASSALVMGADWSTAWVAAPVRLDPVIEGLAPTWVTGAAPGPALRAAAAHLRRERRTAAREAVGRLGVHLVLPLGLCFLPAFVLIGLVPVMVSLGAGLVS